MAVLGKTLSERNLLRNEYGGNRNEFSLWTSEGGTLLQMSEPDELKNGFRLDICHGTAGFRGHTFGAKKGVFILLLF